MLEAELVVEEHIALMSTFPSFSSLSILFTLSRIGISNLNLLVNLLLMLLTTLFILQSGKTRL